jgi:hypothetical protein
VAPADSLSDGGIPVTEQLCDSPQSALQRIHLHRFLGEQALGHRAKLITWVNEIAKSQTRVPFANSVRVIPASLSRFSDFFFVLEGRNDIKIILY